MTTPLTQLLAKAPENLTGVLYLPFELRQKSRFALTVDDHQIVINLPRGCTIQPGQYIRNAKGLTFKIEAALEPVSTAHADSLKQLMEAAYHLGNRHVPLQIGDHWLRYLEDAVIDAMLEGLGFMIVHEQQTFEPLQGAYHRHA